MAQTKFMEIGAEAVVFDYGNTLVLDPFEEVVKNKANELHEVLREYGYKSGKKGIFESWKAANREVNYPHITHFAQEKPIVERALGRLNIKASDMRPLSSIFLSIYRKGLEHAYRTSKRREELENVLSCLKGRGKTLAVLSNGRRFDVQNAMKWYGVAKYFDFVFSSEEIGVEKPDTRAFWCVLEKIKIPPEKVAFVGDDPERDIKPAKTIGMKAILFIPPRGFRKSTPWRRYGKAPIEPDATIRRLADLIKIIC